MSQSKENSLFEKLIRYHCISGHYKIEKMLFLSHEKGNSVYRWREGISEKELRDRSNGIRFRYGNCKPKNDLRKNRSWKEDTYFCKKDSSKKRFRRKIYVVESEYGQEISRTDEEWGFNHYFRYETDFFERKDRLEITIFDPKGIPSVRISGNNQAIRRFLGKRISKVLSKIL